MTLLSASGINVNPLAKTITSPISSIAGTLLGSGTITGVTKRLGINAQGLLLGGTPSFMQYENPAYQTYQKNITQQQANAPATAKSVDSKKLAEADKKEDTKTTDKKNTNKQQKAKATEQPEKKETDKKIDKSILGLTKKATNEPSQYLSLYFDIVKSVRVSVPQEVPQHPVEKGYEISDNIANKSKKIVIEVGFASSPVTWANKNGSGKSKLQKSIQTLNEFREHKLTTSFYRNDGTVYSDLALENYEYGRTDETLSIIWVTLNFVEIRKVSTETITIDPSIVDKANKDGAGGSGADGSAVQGAGDKTEPGKKNVSILKGTYNYISSTDWFKAAKEGFTQGYKTGYSNVRGIAG